MLIVGCGYIGKMLGSALVAKGRTVSGLVSSAASATFVENIGLLPTIADLDSDLTGISLENLCEVFYLVPPPSEGTEDPRLGRFLAHLESHGCAPRFLYMSTTGVYGQCDGAWIDETQAINPLTDRAKRRVDAEKRLNEWSQKSGSETVVLRVAGIYGPERLPIAYLQSGAPVLRAADAPFSNRIQAHDLVNICTAAMDRGSAGATYNVADGSPGSMTEYFFKCADYLGLPRPPEIDFPTARQTMSPALLSYLKENRRIRVTKLLTELNITLAYPDLDAGLRFHPAACSNPPGA